MNCAICKQPLPNAIKVFCDACIFHEAKRQQSLAAMPGSDAKTPLESDAQLEARIYADVLKQNESDLEYFLRRKATLEQRHQNS